METTTPGIGSDSPAPGLPLHLEFTTFIAMEPVAKGRARMMKSGRAYTPGKTRHAEARMQMQVAHEWAGTPLSGPLHVVMVVNLLKPASAPKKRESYPTRRPDLDNFLKTLDALNGIAWADDSQILSITASKRYSTKQGIGIRIYSYVVN